MSTSSPRVYSPYQEAIFRALTEGEGNILVEAVAGSGKTTTIVEGLSRWLAVPMNAGKKVLFVAFSKLIADVLAGRVPKGVDAKTLHSLCFGPILRRFRGIKVGDRKLQEMAKALVESVLGVKDAEANQKVIGDLVKSLGLMRGTMTSLTDLDAINETAAAYGLALDVPTVSLPMLAELDQLLKSDTSACTFDEMLTFILDYGLTMPQYDLICVDEAQDLNRLQIELLKRALKPGGRLVAVGDSRQAIYMFRGADARAMDRIRAEFNVSAGNCLPLSITYRCPRAVVQLAQGWVPHLQAADKAAQGEVITRKESEVMATLNALQPGAMVICRVNAPLVGCALGLIAKGKKAVVRGRDIGKNVTKLAVKLAQGLDDSQIDDLCGRLSAHGDRESAKFRKAHKDAQAQQIEDMCETLWALCGGVQSIRALHARIENLFSDNVEGVVFTSAHKSKGLEADVVVWLSPEKNDAMEMRAKNESAVGQENNLRYVTATRAMKTLIIQPMPEKKREQEG
jgi:DNA helicase-2/ATP-dependent DNA helicase PcrA